MPSHAIQNGVSLNGLSNGESLEILQKSLPHVDLETGLKNRSVKRDPISGLGTQAANGGIKSRTQSLGRRNYNPQLISWDTDSSTTQHHSTNSPHMRTNKTPCRNPITLIGDTGIEVDALNTTGRPRSGKPRDPQRDPISGVGNFGRKEWDPIWKYNGRIRRSKSSNVIHSNPLTGSNVRAYEVMVGEKPTNQRRSEKHLKDNHNIFTGENCSTYTVAPGLKSPKKNGIKTMPKNTLTGENCSTYDVNSEVRTPKKRLPLTKSTNPVSGENVDTFTVSKEERPRNPKPYVYKNTVTGENIQSYKIIPIERNVVPQELKKRQNPINGDNLKTYVYHVGETKLGVKKRDLNSPLTGDGSRGSTYVVSVEERRPHDGQSDNINGVEGNRTRARSHGPMRNILTGDNCQTYSVCQEMRSEKLMNNSNGRIYRGASYNIITGL